MNLEENEKRVQECTVKEREREKERNEENGREKEVEINGEGNK